MLISRKYRFAFIHIYKTGGTSITKALRPFATSRGKRVLARTFKMAHMPAPFDCEPLNSHADALELRDYLGPNEFASLFTFAIVRNPWDWQVSLYKYMLKCKEHYQHDMVKGFGSFDAYIEWRCENDARLQRDFVYEDDELLVDYVGRFERLRKDFGEICDRIGISATLPHLNATKHHPYREYYTSETRRMVAVTFARDIETFGYSF